MGFVEIHDEFAEDISDGDEASEERVEETSDSDALEDFETDEEELEPKTVKVNSITTNGGIVIIKDLTSWLKSPYVEI